MENKAIGLIPVVFVMEENIMTNIYEKILSREITSVELISNLGRKLYIYNGNCWTNVLDKFSFSYTPKELCQHITDYVVWAEYNNTWLDIVTTEKLNLLKAFFDA